MPIIIYFHGNTEHNFNIEYNGLDFCSYLDMNVLIVEYPGYSIYTFEKFDPNIIFSESEIIYD